MPDRKVTAGTTWREFIDARRNSSAFQDRVDEVQSGTFKPVKADPAFKFKLERETAEGADVYTFGNGVESYRFETTTDIRGAREEGAKYALYVRLVTLAGGTPTAFERPTKKGFE